jgi:hypothetical protein
VSPAPPGPPPGPPPLPPVDPVAVDDTVQPVAEHLTEVIVRPLWPGSPAAARAYAIPLTSSATTNYIAALARVSVNTIVGIILIHYRYIAFVLFNILYMEKLNKNSVFDKSNSRIDTIDILLTVVVATE